MGMRKLDIDGETWEFRVGKKNVVIAKDGKKRIVPFDRQDSINSYLLPTTDDGEVTPRIVSDYIRNLIKNKETL